jgi:sugar phosphate isomerase/epimerase
MTNSGTRAGGRKLSLSALTLAGAAPAEAVSAAAAAGFDAVGLSVEPQSWSASTTRAVRERVSDTGLEILDVEVIAIGPDAPDAGPHRLLEIAAEIGAGNVLAIGTDPDRSRLIERFAGLCERAAGGGVALALEFMRFTEVHTVGDALEVVRAAGHPAGAVLVDPLHLARSGGKPADLVPIEPALLPYAQLSDAPVAPPGDGVGPLIAEALEGRLLPGDGGLPLGEFLESLPVGCAFSVEILSAELRQRFPDHVDRARAVWEATRAFLDGTDHS